MVAHFLSRIHALFSCSFPPWYLQFPHNGKTGVAARFDLGQGLCDYRQSFVLLAILPFDVLKRGRNRPFAKAGRMKLVFQPEQFLFLYFREMRFIGV